MSLEMVEVVLKVTCDQCRDRELRVVGETPDKAWIAARTACHRYHWHVSPLNTIHLCPDCRKGQHG